MKILILGGDGYLGWPTSMHFAKKGHLVLTVDNYLRRNIARATSSEALLEAPNLNDRVKIYKSLTGNDIKSKIVDCTDYAQLSEVVRSFQPDSIIHYAEQPSAPYSMMGFSEARETLNNNLNVTLNVVWAVMEHVPDCHIVKLGTMGEYGTPNIDIEEGWLDVEHKGRKQRFLYPRQAGSLYHTTKILDTDLLWFFVRMYGVRVTDLMQGPVYGLITDEAAIDDRLMPNFHYDDIFGTVVNRFLAQAVAGVPLTVYGKGGQTRGYLNLVDTLQCVELSVLNPAKKGDLRIFNQFTETFSVSELADKIRSAAKNLDLEVTVESIKNPRKEMEDHYYNPAKQGLAELGLDPHYMSEEVLSEMLEIVMRHRERLDVRKIMPRISWN